MKNFLIVIIFLGISHIFQAQSSATASFMATATIIQPITINTVSHMNFSQIDAENGGSVVLTPDNTRFATGGVTLAGQEDLSTATFIVTGQSGLAYSIEIPNTSYTLTNGVEDLIIENFTSNIGSDGYLADGKQTFNIGATLNVKAGQAPGYYTSPDPMDVTVIYN